MKVEFVTYQMVSINRQIEPAELRDHSANEDNFLIAHMDAIRENVASGLAPITQFAKAEDKESLDQALSGDEQQFLDVATKMTESLANEMTKVTKQGLLTVFTMVSDDSRQKYVVVLKLQESSSRGAVLEEVADGKRELHAVEHVLDGPQTIQKGLIYPDVRPDSQVMVTERSSKTRAAEYFLRAFGLIMNSRPKDATVQLIAAVAAEDTTGGREILRSVIETLPTMEATDAEITHVIDTIEAREPRFREIREAVSERIGKVNRPISSCEPKASVKQRLTAGSIIIEGPTEDMQAYVDEVYDPATESWRVIVRSDSKPRESFK